MSSKGKLESEMSKTAKTSKTKLRGLPELSDEEGSLRISGSRHGYKMADHGIFREQKSVPLNKPVEIQEETVTIQGAFTNYQFYIVVAVIAVVVALFWRETHTNGNRLTELETIVDNLLKRNDFFKTLEELGMQVKDLEGNFKAASYSLTTLDDKIRAAKSRMSRTDEVLDSQVKNLHEVTLDLNKQIEKQEGLENHLEQNNKQLNIVKEESKTIEKSLNTSSMTIKSLEDKITGLDQRFSESDMKFKNAINTQSILEERVSSIQQEMEDLSNNTNAIGGKLPDFETKTGELLRKIVTAEGKLVQISQLEGNVNKLEDKIHRIVEDSNEMKYKTTVLLENVKTFEIKILEQSSKLNQYNNEIKEATGKQDLLVEDLDKLKKDTKTTSENSKKVLEKTISLKEDLDKTEKEVKEKIKTIGENISNTDSEVKHLTNLVENYKEYNDQQVPALKTRLNEVEKMANFPYFCVIDILEIIVIIMVILAMRDSSFSSSAATMEGSSGTTRYASNYVRPQSILGKINRAPVFENKICIVSFYSETLNLHKMMLVAALQNSRRAQGFQIVQNLIKRHEDILEIPNARYIFVFVDFNETNVILENPGQNLGDKKLVTVQAACKLGATVFVTYVRNKGSKTLPPGVLYNTELTAFTSHFVLKGLTAEGRCFSVYESFSQSQKEHIAEAIH